MRNVISSIEMYRYHIISIEQYINRSNINDILISTYFLYINLLFATVIRFIIVCVMTRRFKVRQSITAVKYYKLEKNWSRRVGQVHFLKKSYLFKLCVVLYIAERSMQKSDKFNTFITIFRPIQYDLWKEEPTMSRTWPAFVLKYRNGGANVNLSANVLRMFGKLFC